LIRVAAAMGIIGIHFCMGVTAGHSSIQEWFAVGLFSPFFGASLDLFIMVSGFLLLSRKTLWDKRFFPRIGRIFLLITAWSIINLALRKLMYGTTLEGNPITLFEAVRCFLSNQCHSNLWFLWMIASLYFVSPILHTICRDKFTVRYFLILSFFSFTLYAWGCNLLCYLFHLEQIYFSFPFVTSIACGYFVAGWYFGADFRLRSNSTKAACLGALLVLLLALSLAVISTFLGTESGFREFWVGKFDVVFAIVLFLCLKEWGSSEWYQHSFLCKICNTLAPLTLGIYLLHDIVRHVLSDGLLFGLKFNIHFLPAMISIPLGVFTIFIISAALTWCMQKIPAVRILVQ
jgi:surface polysaccharide O-acyltransferase-like enzyme